MSKNKIQSLVAYKKELRKSILKNYQALKEKISLLKHHELKELVSEWNFDSEELDNDLLSLDTDDLRNNYLDEYLASLQALGRSKLPDGMVIMVNMSAYGITQPTKLPMLICQTLPRGSARAAK